MLYYAYEVTKKDEECVSAGIKARDDVDRILKADGAATLSVEVPSLEKKSAVKKIFSQVSHYRKWKRIIGTLKKGDTLLVQFPLIYSHTIFFSRIVQKLKKRGIGTILLIHDLEIFRWVLRDDLNFLNRMRLSMQEKTVLKKFDSIIAHNEAMIEELVKLGIDREKIVSLGIFDYLFDVPEDKALPQPQYGEPVIIAGNLRPHKAAYAYSLPDKPAYNLYGLDYTGKGENIHYFGAFPADDLPFAMHGSFGLVWDGESVETCSGAYGQYLKINNPHKTSLYLACGIPVIIWSQAALAPFILENNVGIVVDSLNDIPTVSPEDYAVMRENAEKIGTKLRRGEMLKTAVEKCL